MTLNSSTRPSLSLRLRRHAEASDGFAMVELMISIIIFGILSAAVLTTLNFAIGLTRSDRNRVAASTLAARELEIVRRDFNSAVAGKGPGSIALNQVVNPTPLPLGTAGAPLIVDNVSYTLTREAQWTTAGTAAPTSACDNGNTTQLTTMRVHVRVTWANMGATPPIVADTLLTPSRGIFPSTAGHIAVKVLDRSGAGVGNRTVSINGPSGSFTGKSAADGCALFPFLLAGTYTVSVNDAGYVDRQGATTPTVTATVVAAQIWKGNFDYDRAATINGTFVTTDAAYPLPFSTDLTLALGNSGLLPSGSTSRPAPPNGVTRIATNLWPYSSGYQLWAGDCLDADPLTTGDPRAAPVTVTPGSTTSANVDLGQVGLAVARGSSGVPGVTVQAVHATDSSCPAGDTVTLGVTGALGVLRASLPYGTWTLKAVGETASGSWPTVIVRRGQPRPLALVSIV